MISTPVNAEITEYHEKIVAGLSIRQLLCFGAAAAVSIGSAVLGIYVFHVDINSFGYVLMLEVVPFLALGWFRLKGYVFEKYALIWLRWQLFDQRLSVKNYKEVPRKNVWKMEKRKNCECSIRHGDAGAGAAAARKAAATAKREIKKDQSSFHTQFEKNPRQRSRDYQV